MNYFVVSAWLILTVAILCYVFVPRRTHKPIIVIPASPTMTPRSFHTNGYVPIMMDDGFHKKHLV